MALKSSEPSDHSEQSDPAQPSPKSNLWLWLTGLGIALVIAVGVSPFASQDPDGLDRVAQDLKFEHHAATEPIARRLPFAQIFDEYAVQGVPESFATPLAGLVGTLVTFGLAWGIGKVVVGRQSGASESPVSPSDPDS